MRTCLPVLMGVSVVGFASLARAEAQDILTMTANLGAADSRVRAQAALALSQAGARAESALPGLTRALGDSSFNVRYWAATVLQHLGPKAKPAAPALIGALRTYPGGGPELEGPARYFPDVRVVAAQALGRIGPPAKVAVPALQAATRDPNGSVRAAAAEALNQIQGKEGLVPSE